MVDYKEYRSVTEFPLHTENLSREELDAAYQDLRTSYRHLGVSRGQLVRRQTETKAKLVTIDQSLKQLTATLAKVQQEKQQLQKALTHSEQARKQLDTWSNDLIGQVDDLQAQMAATTKLLSDFEVVYEETQSDSSIFSVWTRFQRLLAAAQRLLTTDVKLLAAQTRQVKPLGSSNQPADWTRDTPATINRSLRDE
jgi:chromosome segregation ATPase